MISIYLTLIVSNECSYYFSNLYKQISKFSGTVKKKKVSSKLNHLDPDHAGIKIQEGKHAALHVHVNEAVFVPGANRH